MATMISERQGAWRLFSSVTVTSGVPTGNSLDMREFSQGAIYATSTHGVPVLTFYTAPTSDGTYRLAKTSTGGAVTLTIVANSAVKFPAAAAALGFLKLSSSTTAAPKTLPFVLLKKT